MQNGETFIDSYYKSVFTSSVETFTNIYIWMMEDLVVLRYDTKCLSRGT
jgi:hypothetical protein